MRSSRGGPRTRLLATVASVLLLVGIAGCDSDEEEQAGPPPERIHCDDGLWDDLDLRELLDLPTEQVEINNTLPVPRHTVVGLCSVRVEGESILRLRIEPSDEDHTADFLADFGQLGTDLGDLDAFLYNYDPDEPDEPLVVYGIARTALQEDRAPRPYIIDLTFQPGEDRDPIEDAHQLAEGVIDYIESHLQRRDQRRT